MNCQYLRVIPDAVGSGVTIEPCGRPAHYRDMIGRALCADCVPLVFGGEERESIFGPAGRPVLLAPVH